MGLTRLGAPPLNNGCLIPRVKLFTMEFFLNEPLGRSDCEGNVPWHHQFSITFMHGLMIAVGMKRHIHSENKRCQDAAFFSAGARDLHVPHANSYIPHWHRPFGNGHIFPTGIAYLKNGHIPHWHSLFGEWPYSLLV